MTCDVLVDGTRCGRPAGHLGVHYPPDEPQFRCTHPPGEDCGGAGCIHCARVFLGGFVDDNPLRLRRADIPRYLGEAGASLCPFVVQELLRFRPEWTTEVEDLEAELGR